MFPETLLIGCGRLGSALMRGWLDAGVDPARLAIAHRSVSDTARAAAEAGVRLVRDPNEVEASIVVLGVKPAVWREAAAPLAERAPGVLVSLMAGVRALEMASALPGWRIIRFMPTTGIAARRGAAAWWAEGDDARLVDALFSCVARVVRVKSEADLDLATAMSGSGQAYVFAFAQSLAAAGAEAGLPPETAVELARATLISAAATVETDRRSIENLIDEVASPGGTTRAGLAVLEAEGLVRITKAAVEASLSRVRELATDA